MTNSEISRLFSAIATMLEMDGANVFRIRAYREAARVIEELPEPAATMAATEGRLREVKGIGKDLETKIRDFVTRGSTEVYDELLKKYPASIVELTEIQGLGPKRVKTLFEKLGIRDRAGLAAAAKEDRIKDLAGFGETVQKNVLKAVAAFQEGPARMLIAGAWNVAHEMAERVRKIKGVDIVELAGSFRRRRETIGDLDVLVCGGSPDDVMEAFVTHAYVAEVLGRGETKSSVKLGNGLQVDLRLVPVESFGAALLYFTGSKAHNIELRRIAIENGMSLNEYGLTRGEKVVASRTEEDVYKALGLAWIPPELREAGDEIQLAREGHLPVLIEEKDLRGDLHMHTDRSDGRDTLADMVRACRDYGYEYCAITDHSKALGMTNGFDAARVRQSVHEIAAVRREVPGIQVLHGIEVDILADGTLDLDDETLGLLDWVIVSLHSSLNQPPDVVTKRVLDALEHPSVRLMGHPSGRKIGARDGAAIDFTRVFARAAELGIAMEINAQPDRMDLSDVNARAAREAGLRFCIDTDAHTTGSLEYARYGVFNARRAGLTKEHVLNSMPYAAFEKWRVGERTVRATETKTKPDAKPKATARAPATATTKTRPKAKSR